MEVDVISVEEKVAFLDGTVKGHTKMIDGLREAVVHLEQRMDSRFIRLETRLDERFNRTDDKLDRQFRWLVGILFTSVLAMLGILGSVLPIALRR